MAAKYSATVLYCRGSSSARSANGALRGPRRARVGARGTRREGKPKYKLVFSSNVSGIFAGIAGSLCVLRWATRGNHRDDAVSRSRFIALPPRRRHLEKRDKHRSGIGRFSRIDAKEKPRSVGRASDYRHLGKKKKRGKGRERERHRFEEERLKSISYALAGMMDARSVRCGRRSSSRWRLVSPFPLVFSLSLSLSSSRFASIDTIRYQRCDAIFNVSRASSDKSERLSKKHRAYDSMDRWIDP